MEDNLNPAPELPRDEAPEIAALPLVALQLRELRPQPGVRVLLLVTDCGACQFAIALSDEQAESLATGLAQYVESGGPRLERVGPEGLVLP